MANMLIPIEERNLSPEEVAQLDARRRRGQAYLVIGFQTLIVSLILSMWSGQDATYSPGWAHPVLYWNIVTASVSIFCFMRGLRLRRGSNEFFSY
jgi:hypothetical protein